MIPVFFLVCVGHEFYHLKRKNMKKLILLILAFAIVGGSYAQKFPHPGSRTRHGFWKTIPRWEISDLGIRKWELQPISKIRNGNGAELDRMEFQLKWRQRSKWVNSCTSHQLCKSHYKSSIKEVSKIPSQWRSKPWSVVGDSELILMPVGNTSRVKKKHWMNYSSDRLRLWFFKVMKYGQMLLIGFIFGDSCVNRSRMLDYLSHAIINSLIKDLQNQILSFTGWGVRLFAQV